MNIGSYGHEYSWDWMCGTSLPESGNVFISVLLAFRGRSTEENMFPKFGVAIVTGVAIAMLSATSSFAIDPRLSDALGRAAQQKAQQDAIGNAIGNAAGARNAGSQAGRAAGSVYKMPNLNFGCLNWTRC